jgi:hypothetical protein
VAVVEFLAWFVPGIALSTGGLFTLVNRADYLTANFFLRLLGSQRRIAKESKYNRFASVWNGLGMCFFGVLCLLAAFGW